MIKEFMLIIYIVGGGRAAEDESYNYSTNFQFQRFSTMEQCEFVKTTAKKMQSGWYYGKDSDNIIPSHYSIKCVELPPGPVVQTTVPHTIPTPPVKRQWDWNETP